MWTCTTAVTVPASLQAEAIIEFRSGGVLAGAAYADAVALACDCRIEWRAPDGRLVRAGTMVGVVRGALARILRAERPMLNLLQRASGIATATRAYVDAVAGTGCRILHTRKTAPGLRALDIAAVLAGGGARHRADLSHEVMVKDNHWQAVVRSGGSLADALAEARGRGISALYVEVESTDAARPGVRRRRQPPAGGQPDAGHGVRLGRPRARTAVRGSRSKRRVGSRWRTCGRTQRRGWTSSRSGR